MSIRPLLFCSLLLLGACSSEAPQPPNPAPTTPPQPADPKPEQPANPYLHQLSGSLHTPPAGSDVEIALLVIDERDRPQRLLASLHLKGTGQTLPFELPFNPEAFPQGARVELRARVSLSGRLIQHIGAQRIQQSGNQTLGNLQLVSAP